MDEKDLLIQNLRAENRKLRDQLHALQESQIEYFDIEEIHSDCTVQILKNSETGAISVGWWENI